MTPLIILSGFLGAGKTTTMKHLLENNDNLKLGVIANDVASVNIDAALIKNQTAEAEEKDATGKQSVTTLQLENGCLCCSSSEGLIVTIKQLLDMDQCFDYIVVESTGVAEPANVCRVIADAAKRDPEFQKKCTVGNMVTVIDVEHFANYYNSADTMAEKPSLWESESETANKEQQAIAQRMLADLLVEQVECADTLILNKVDCMPDLDRLQRTKDAVACLNPSAEMHQVSWGKIDPNILLQSTSRAGSEMYNAVTSTSGRDGMQKRAISAVPAESKAEEQVHQDHGEEHHRHDEGHHHHDEEHHHHDEEHHHHDEEHHHHDEGHHHHDEGHNHENCNHSKHPWNSFVFSSKRPFHGPSLATNVLSQLKQAQQAKRNPKSGIDTAGNPFMPVVRSKGFVWIAQQPSKRLYWSHAGLHFAVQPDGVWPTSGKPVQELVFIGFGMDEKVLRDTLENALVPEDEWNSRSSV